MPSSKNFFYIHLLMFSFAKVNAVLGYTSDGGRKVLTLF